MGRAQGAGDRKRKDEPGARLLARIAHQRRSDRKNADGRASIHTVSAGLFGTEPSHMPNVTTTAADQTCHRLSVDEEVRYQVLRTRHDRIALKGRHAVLRQ
jgi:hypothetical protein